MVLRFVLWWCSLWYAAAIWARLRLYGMGVFSSVGVDVPVICVGNITTGGTGKTPAVAHVVKLLQSWGHKPAVVSRGYRSGEDGNDEKAMLEQHVEGVILVENPDRVAAARDAMKQGADVIVMDDGFSHLRLKRDLDVLLFDSLNPFGYARWLPRGLLREPINSVRRAEFAILTRADVATPERLRDLEDTVRCKGFAGDLAHAAHRPSGLRRLNANDTEEVEWLRDRQIAAFCAIGHPRGFLRTLQSTGAKMAEAHFCELDDHAHYNPGEIALVTKTLEQAKGDGVEVAICTAKDAVKLKGADFPLPVWVLDVEFDITRGEDLLHAALKKVLDA